MRKYLVEAKSEIFDLYLFFTSLLEVMSSFLSLSTICCDMKKTTTVSYFFYLLFGNFFLSPWNKIENLLLPFFVPLNYIFELMEAQKKSGGQRTFKKEPLKLSFWQKGGWPAWNLELESGLYISIFYLEKATETFDTFPTFANDILKTLKIIAFNFFVHFLFCSALISKGKVFH